MIVQFELMVEILNDTNLCYSAVLWSCLWVVFNFLYHLFVLVGGTVSSKKSIELFKNGNC